MIFRFSSRSLRFKLLLPAAAVLAFACPLRAEPQLSWQYFAPAPAGSQYITGLTEAKGQLMLITRTEVWEADVKAPTSFSRVFDPTFAGVSMHQGSVTFYDSSADLYYFSGGLFDTRIYVYNSNNQSMVGQAILLNLDDAPSGIAVSGGNLYATFAGAVNVYPADPVQDAYPSAQFGVGLLQDARGVALDQTASSLFVLDTGNQQIARFALAADSASGIAAGDVLGSIPLVKAATAGTLLYSEDRLFTFDLQGDGVVYDASTGAELAVFQFDAAGAPPIGFGGKLATTVSSDGATLYLWDYGTMVKSYDLTSIDGPGPIFNTNDTPTLATPFSSTGIVTIQGNGGSLTLASGASAGETVNLNPGNELIVSRDASLDASLLRILGGSTPAHVTVQGDADSRGVLSIETVTSFGAPQSGYLALDGGILRANADASVSVPVQLLASGGWLDSDGHALRLDGPISGAGELTKTGAGTLTLTTTNTYTGATTVNAGTLLVNGSIAASSLTTVNAGGTLGGSGTVGALTIAGGGTLDPGNSPGTLSAGDTTFAAGGNFAFQINAATGATGTNWDLLAITGTLDLTGPSSGNPFNLSLTSLLPDNSPGALADFDAAQSYSWVFVQTTGGISGFTADGFAIDGSQFINPINGTWSITSDGTNLSLAYTATAVPEPAICASIFGALALGVVGVRELRGRKAAVAVEPWRPGRVGRNTKRGQR